MTENQLTVVQPFKPKIVWESWKDPYGSNIDDVEWPGWNTKKPTLETALPFDKDEDEDDEDDDEEIASKNPMKIVLTPMGIVPMTEYTMPSKIFNFWVAHTNFDITEEIGHLVELTPGIETLDIFTRYRMRVGIGKVFEFATVREELNNKINEHFNKCLL